MRRDSLGRLRPTTYQGRLITRVRELAVGDELFVKAAQVRGSLAYWRRRTGFDFEADRDDGGWYVRRIA